MTVLWAILSSCASAGVDPQNHISDSRVESIREECVAGGMADLDAEIALLEENAQTRPELYIDIAERLYRKAEMYRLQVARLELRQERNFREEREVTRVKNEALEKALGALEKVLGKVYPDTDVRMLKALVYIALERVPEAMKQLEELAGDPEANPALRQQAGEWLGELGEGM
jgi:hypothetical protein